MCKNNRYQQLRKFPPEIKVKANAKEVIFTTISAMCDNVYYLTFKKSSDGYFNLNGNGFAISNWQMKYPKHDLEWEADDENWVKVVDMINSGTALVESVKSR